MTGSSSRSTTRVPTSEFARSSASGRRGIAASTSSSAARTATSRGPPMMPPPPPGAKSWCCWTMTTCSLPMRWHTCRSTSTPILRPTWSTATRTRLIPTAGVIRRSSSPTGRPNCCWDSVTPAMSRRSGGNSTSGRAACGPASRARRTTISGCGPRSWPATSATSRRCSTTGGSSPARRRSPATASRRASRPAAAPSRRRSDAAASSAGSCRVTGRPARGAPSFSR